MFNTVLFLSIGIVDEGLKHHDALVPAESAHLTHLVDQLEQVFWSVAQADQTSDYRADILAQVDFNLLYNLLFNFGQLVKTWSHHFESNFV